MEDKDKLLCIMWITTGILSGIFGSLFLLISSNILKISLDSASLKFCMTIFIYTGIAFLGLSFKIFKIIIFKK